VFTGAHRVRVDDKGRLAITAALRKQLSEGSFLSVSHDNVLPIHPPALWADLAHELRTPLPRPYQCALARTLSPRPHPLRSISTLRGRRTPSSGSCRSESSAGL